VQLYSIKCHRMIVTYNTIKEQEEGLCDRMRGEEGKEFDKTVNIANP
jgi:hypothetical protein